MSNERRAIGRMIRRDLSDDVGESRLSNGAARLKFHLTTWLDSWGKYAGGPGTIQETVAPLLKWTRKRIIGYLAEINRHTSMKVWTQNGRYYVHDVRFFDVQEIREDRRGTNRLPSYPGACRMKPAISAKSVPEYVPDLVPREVELEVEKEVEGETESRPFDGATAPAGVPEAPAGAAPAPRKGGGNGSLQEDILAWGERMSVLAPAKRKALGIGE